MNKEKMNMLTKNIKSRFSYKKFLKKSKIANILFFCVAIILKSNVAYTGEFDFINVKPQKPFAEMSPEEKNIEYAIRHHEMIERLIKSGAPDKVMLVALRIEQEQYQNNLLSVEIEIKMKKFESYAAFAKYHDDIWNGKTDNIFERIQRDTRLSTTEKDKIVAYLHSKTGEVNTPFYGIGCVDVLK